MADSQFIFGHCPTCAERYRLPSNASGKRARCRVCGSVFVVDPEDKIDATVMLSEPGYTIRHVARERDFQLAAGDDENIEAISAHIERYIGPVHKVFHEIISDLVHVDIHWVQPTNAKPFHTLITSGMSDRPMKTPERTEECQYAELMTRLPPDWKMSEADFKNEAWYWPLRWLKILARLPHEYDTWLWEGHTVPHGDPPEPFAPNTKLCGVILLRPMTDEAFWELSTGEKTIHFFGMYPLYAEEMNHKLSHGAESLLPRFEKHGVSDVIDLNRKNVCAKRFGLW